MGLRPKFNIVLFFVFVAGFASVKVIAERFLIGRATEEIAKNAAVAIETLSALPDKTNDISSLARISRIKATFPTLDFRNIDARAPLVAPGFVDPPDLVSRFNAKPGVAEFTGETGSKESRRYYVARAVRDSSGKVETINLVTIGMRFYVHDAERGLYTLLGSLLTIFTAVFLLLNLLLDRMIVRPITQIAKTADAISIGNLDIPEIKPESKDEIGMLVIAFNRLRRSTEEAIRMLSK